MKKKAQRHKTKQNFWCCCCFGQSILNTHKNRLTHYTQTHTLQQTNKYIRYTHTPTHNKLKLVYKNDNNDGGSGGCSSCCCRFLDFRFCMIDERVNRTILKN